MLCYVFARSFIVSNIFGWSPPLGTCLNSLRFMRLECSLHPPSIPAPKYRHTRGHSCVGYCRLVPAQRAVSTMDPLLKRLSVAGSVQLKSLTIDVPCWRATMTPGSASVQVRGGDAAAKRAGGQQI